MMVLSLNTLGISLPIDKCRTKCLENWRYHGVCKLRWKLADGWVLRVTHGYYGHRRACAGNVKDHVEHDGRPVPRAAHQSQGSSDGRRVLGVGDDVYPRAKLHGERCGTQPAMSQDSRWPRDRQRPFRAAERCRCECPNTVNRWAPPPPTPPPSESARISSSSVSATG